MSVEIGHEKLHVYRRGLEYISWTHSVLSCIPKQMAVIDHWERAAESMVVNIANGNSRRSRTDRNRYFNFAVGSALECAACLDICMCRNLITHGNLITGKTSLLPIVKMIMGLRKSASDYIKEDPASYVTSKDREIFFAHEKLDVYKCALDLIVWFDAFLNSFEINPASASFLDKTTTSLVLNIAEGNGRYSKPDQIRFLDVAHTCAIRIGAHIDCMSVKGLMKTIEVEKAKSIITQIIPLLLGLRKYLKSRN